MTDINTIVKESTSRVYFLDWLRVLSIIAVFFFHNARLFDEFSDWHVKNATTNFGASIVVAYLSQWIMPFFFILAGASVYFAFRRRNAVQYTLNRTLRLLIPFVFGMLVIVVPQSYYEQLQRGYLLDTSFFTFYPQYIVSLNIQYWFHLWFLLYLFGFSLITIPLFLPFGKDRKSLIMRMSKFINTAWVWILVLIIAITFADILIFPNGFWGQRDSGGWNIVSYIVFFIFGYIIFSNNRLIDSLTRFRWYFFICGVVLLGILFIFFVDPIAEPETYFGTMSYNFAHLLRAIHSCAWMMAFIGIASRHLNFSNRFLSYSSESVLPFYVLHQTAIVSIGYYVVALNAEVLIKYFLTALTSFVTIMLVYETAARHFVPLRFLFGMNLSRRK